MFSRAHDDCCSSVFCVLLLYQHLLRLSIFTLPQRLEDLSTLLDIILNHMQVTRVQTLHSHVVRVKYSYLREHPRDLNAQLAHLQYNQFQ